MNYYNAGFQDIKIIDKFSGRTLDVALWYPTVESESEINYLGDYPGFAAENAPYLNNNCPLIVSSHGSGGHRFNQYYLGEALARCGYYFAAVEHHNNNHINNNDESDIANFYHRPRDIKRVIDYFQKTISANSIQRGVTILGHSYGGYAALVLAGGKPDQSVMNQLFTNHGGINLAELNVSDKRVSAIILLAPALAEAFTNSQLNNVLQPLLLVISEQDQMIGGKDKRYIELLSRKPSYVEFENAGHYVYLMPIPEAIKDRLPQISQDIGLAREDIHPRLINDIKCFLARDVY